MVYILEEYKCNACVDSSIIRINITTATDLISKKLVFDWA